MGVYMALYGTSCDGQNMICALPVGRKAVCFDLSSVGWWFESVRAWVRGASVHMVQYYARPPEGSYDLPNPQKATT